MIPVIPPTAQRKDYARLLSNTINALVRAVNQSGTSVTRGEVIFSPKAEPSDPVEGQTYMDAATHNLRTFDGTVWQDQFGASVTRGDVIFSPKAEPTSPVEGQTYMDSTTHKLRTYDGTIWQDHW